MANSSWLVLVCCGLRFTLHKPFKLLGLYLCLLGGLVDPQKISHNENPINSWAKKKNCPIETLLESQPLRLLHLQHRSTREVITDCFKRKSLGKSWVLSQIQEKNDEQLCFLIICLSPTLGISIWFPMFPIVQFWNFGRNRCLFRFAEELFGLFHLPQLVPTARGHEWCTENREKGPCIIYCIYLFLSESPYYVSMNNIFCIHHMLWVNIWIWRQLVT